MRTPALVTLIPRSSATSLRLTIRFGWTTSSFISDSRSVPPARTSASAQFLPSRATACSFVVGLAYSNPRIVASLLFERVQHSIRRERQIWHAHSDCVGHRVRDHRAGRNHGRLTQADHSALVVAFAGHHMNFQLTDVADAGQFVELHVWVQHSAGLRVHDLLFIERIADTHDQGAINLALGSLEVDDQAAVLHGDYPVDPYDSCFYIDGNIRHLRPANALVHESPRSGVFAANGQRSCAEFRASLGPSH